MNQIITLPAILLTIAISAFFLQKIVPNDVTQDKAVTKTSSQCITNKTNKPDCEGISEMKIAQSQLGY